MEGEIVKVDQGAVFGCGVLLAALMLGGCTQIADQSDRPGAAAGIGSAAARDRVLPWEWWKDLSVISVVPDGDRTVMRSSHSPDGGQFDRHSAGDSRFIETLPNGEGVIFRAEGAGAITRIWMVMGHGISEPLDPSIRIRIRIDGGDRPVVDLPIPALFDGSAPPFVPPLVADQKVSGGGQVSYVPIPFRHGCEVTLVGADEAKIWFQVVARLVADPTGVRSFTGEEDLTGFAETMNRAGGDPWPGGPYPTISGAVVLEPGGTHTIADLDGPDVVNGLILRVDRRSWHRIGLRLTFDDHEPQLIPVLQLVGRPRVFGGAMRSLLVGVDADEDLYCYFPMPFSERARVELLRRPIEGPPTLRVEYALRTMAAAPPEDAGVFRVQTHRYDKDDPVEAFTLMDVSGAGSLVGIALEQKPSDARDWTFLEGDERIWIDGESEPSWHGTGVEDFFNGGFYFRSAAGRPTPFQTALAGASALRSPEISAAMHRLLLGDAVLFRTAIRVELERGPTSGQTQWVRSTAYYYTRSQDVPDH